MGWLLGRHSKLRQHFQGDEEKVIGYMLDEMGESGMLKGVIARYLQGVKAD